MKYFRIYMISIFIHFRAIYNRGFLLYGYNGDRSFDKIALSVIEDRRERVRQFHWIQIVFSTCSVSDFSGHAHA